LLYTVGVENYHDFRLLTGCNAGDLLF